MLFFFLNSIFVIFSGRAYLWVQSGFELHYWYLQTLPTINFNPIVYEAAANYYNIEIHVEYCWYVKLYNCPF